MARLGGTPATLLGLLETGTDDLEGDALGGWEAAVVPFAVVCLDLVKACSTLHLSSNYSKRLVRAHCSGNVQEQQHMRQLFTFQKGCVVVVVEGGGTATGHLSIRLCISNICSEIEAVLCIPSDKRLVSSPRLQTE